MIHTSNRERRGVPDFLSMFKAKPPGPDAPRPLGGGLHPQKSFPGAAAELAPWLVWAMEASSVAACFWTICAQGTDKQWSEAVALFKPRAEALFDGDGSMVFDRFSHVACESAANGNPLAIKRFAWLFDDPELAPWIIGPLGRAFRDDGYASRASWRPKAVEMHLKALEQGWDGAPEALGAAAKASLDLWLDFHRKIKQGPFDQGGALAAVNAIVLCGSIQEPGDRCANEKSMLRSLWDELDPEHVQHAWIEALREGPEAVSALRAIVGADPVLDKAAVAALCSSDGAADLLNSAAPAIHDEDGQRADAAALLLADSLGWLPPKLMAKAISTCKHKGLAAQLAMLEQRQLDASPAAPGSKPAPRI